MLVGGVESMSRAPWVLLKPERPYPRGHETLHSTTLGWRMVNPEMPEEWTISLGREHGEGGGHATGSRARRRTSSRCAATSSRPQAWDAGFYDRRGSCRCRCDDGEHARDEGIRPDTSVEKLAKLKPAFAQGRHGHGGQRVAAQRRRGRDADRRRRRAPRRPGSSRSRGSPAAARSRSTPTCSGSRRSRRPTARSSAPGIGWGDIEVAELNEAFAAQSLACLGEWKELDPERLNVNGGAIAIGHPLGASGVRILGTLAHELRRRGGGWGIAAICIGVGQGLAVVIEA